MNLVLEDGVYGIQLPEVGDLAGYAAPATAVYGFQEFEWSSNAGKIDHQRTAALQNFYGKSPKGHTHLQRAFELTVNSLQGVSPSRAVLPQVGKPGRQRQPTCRLPDHQRLPELQHRGRCQAFPLLEIDIFAET